MIDINNVYIKLWKNRKNIFKINDVKNKDTRMHEILNRSIELVSPKKEDLDLDSRLDLAIYQIL